MHKTWSPTAQTPIIRPRYRHDRISAISGIAVSRRRFHRSLYCLLYEDNIQGEQVAWFLRHLLRRIPGHVFVLLDRARIHRPEPAVEIAARTQRLHLVPFPACAPELNPDEGVWNQLKKALANGRPDSQSALVDMLGAEVCRLAVAQDLLRAGIKRSHNPRGVFLAPGTQRRYPHRPHLGAIQA